MGSCRSTAGVAEGERSSPVGGLGSPGAEDWRGVDGGIIAGRHTERTKTSEKVRGVAGVRDGEIFGRGRGRRRSQEIWGRLNGH